MLSNQNTPHQYHGGNNGQIVFEYFQFHIMNNEFVSMAASEKAVSSPR